MIRMKRRLTLILLSVLTALLMCLGVAFTMPTKVAKAESLSTENWTFARENENEFRIQNGTAYWTTYTNNVTTASMLDYTEINGRTLSEINAENPGAITVTLQPAGGSIGSFYRVIINPSIAGFNVLDIGTVVVKAGWSHTDANATYTIDTNLYFAKKHNQVTQSDTMKYIPATKVVDITNDIQLQDQGIQATNTRSILISTSDKSYWAGGNTPNENGGAFLNMLYINGTSVMEWNEKAHADLDAGNITDITYGSGHGTISGNKGVYAPIFVWNTGYTSPYGSYSQVWIPTGYISNVSSFKVAKGFAHLQDDGTLYYVSQDVEYVKSGSTFSKVASAVDISDAFKILVQDYTSGNGTMLYYLHTNNVQYWTAQYDSTEAYSINEKEWKGEQNVSLQGGAVQMSYLELNGTPIYDINASDNGAYGATHGTIASGGKYAPILAFLTPQEQGNSIKLQVPSAYPSGSGTAADNHTTITIKKGFYVVDTSTNIKYEVTKDIQWDYENGAWGEHLEKIEATIEDVCLFGSSSDAFAGIKIAGNDYPTSGSHYAGDAKTALSFAQNANFYKKILVDDVTMAKPGEAFLNVWGNYGYFTFRTGNNDATKITVLAGCQIPTYDALLNGTNEVYVTTEDVTYVKGSDGTWSEQTILEAGEYETSIRSVVYARDNENNWMMFRLGDKDYPSVNKDDDSTFNIATTEAKISALNLYDKIVVDGYTLRARIATNGNPTEAPKINLWVADCFAIRIAGCEGALTGAQKVTIKAGAQFPSYAYITEGIEAYYVIPEDVTFVNVGDASGAWAQQYKVTYVVDGEVFDESTYVHASGETPTDPEVPAKAGYRGAWESYTVGSATNITVNAVYTKAPTSLGTTSIKTLRNINAENQIFVIEPTNSDYPASVNDASYNIGLDVSHLEQFNLFDYILINDQTLREIGVTEAKINKFTRAGLGLTTTLSSSMTVVIKEGCEIPSYEFWQNPTDASKYSCYTVDATYTCVYAAASETGFTITKEVSSNTTDSSLENFDDHYVLSDLQKVGYVKTDVFKDGYETLTNTGGSEADYRYGYIGSTSFALSFDFKFDSAAYYNTLQVNLGTDGYGGNKFHFGWRFYLLRGNDTDGTVPNQCVEYFSNTSSYSGNITGSAEKTLGSAAFVAKTVYSVTIGYKLVNASTGEVMVYTSINGDSRIDNYVLGGTFVNFAPYINSLTMSTSTTGTVTVSDPSLNMNSVPYKLTLDGIDEIYTSQIYLPDVNPVDYNMDNCVFVGWTTEKDFSNITSSNLYNVGARMLVNSDKTLYPVWLEFNMESGAAVRATVGSSGLRYTVNVDKDIYAAWTTAGIILEVGSILAPTDYLADTALTHDLGSGRYIQNVTEKWQVENAVYTSAFTNISYDQYGRQFSARGYLKIKFKSGSKYVYTTYNAGDHSRSIYDVATAAYNDGYSNNAVVKSYVNDVADIVIDSDLNASKNTNAVGTYTVGTALSGNTLTVTISNGSVKAAIINGTRIVMGKQANVMIGNVRYLINGYKLNNDGLQLTFTIEQKETLGKEYYIGLLQEYIDSTVYTKTHKAYVADVVNTAISAIEASDSSSVWAAKYAEADELIKTVKTAVELAANDTSDTRLATPTLSKGLGYTVTWNAIENADYYTVSDNNDYRTERVVLAGEALTYKAEVIGDHNITVTAHSYFDSLNSSFASNQVATPKVKPVFSYKSMLDGMYKFDSNQMKSMGISTDGYYKDETAGEYIVYYNKDIGWTPYPALATDWTSPAEFPTHAQRLKDLGNNVILIAYDTEASYDADETWETSRMKYVMDTAWTMGMKVLVCDEVFYDLSMSDSDHTKTCAQSVAAVTTAIENRDGFEEYVTHPAFYGFSLDDEPYYEYIDAMTYTITALDRACADLGVEPFYLACLFQYYGSDKLYTGNTLQNYYKAWLNIEGVDNQYLYVDIYTQHAMDYPLYSITNRYENSFNAVYGSSNLGGKYDFYQAITCHTQNSGTLTEQDLYMSLMYAAAHDVAGYAWFCYFPIAAEPDAASMVGYDGYTGYGNGVVNGNTMNNASGSYYEAAKKAGYQFELIQWLLDGYDWQTRSVSGNLLTTTLSNGSNTATVYVNADEDNMKDSVTVTVSGSQCYLVGYDVGTAEAPYEAVSGSVTLKPGQAVFCIN